MSMAAWILIVATHVNYGAQITMQEFADKPSCEYAARAAREVARDAGGFYGDAHTYCAPKFLEMK